MADFTGIQAVTSTLRQLLMDNMEDAPAVTAAPPDVEETSPPLVNLFLYRISENGALKNQDLPGMTGPASLGRPPLSLDLHYLVTTTGPSPEDDEGAHRVLGDAMLALHDHPIVAKDDPALDPALQGEVELLKITLAPLNSEELTKVWTATTAPYRLSVGYTVTVVQLESTLPRRIAKPVLEPPDRGPRVHVLPLDRPVIAAVSVIRLLPDLSDGPEQPLAYARIGDKLVVSGSGFYPGTRVLLHQVDATLQVQAGSTSSRYVVAVPDDAALQPGVRRLQLVRDVTLGQPPDDRTVPALKSNLASFVLVPTVSEVLPSSGPDGTTVTVKGRRLFVQGAPSMVLVGDSAFPPAAGATSTEVQVAVTGLAPGVYPVSVRVSGAESIDPATFEVTS